MRKTTKPGQPVEWSIGRKPNLTRMVGTVESINGDWVQVRAHGSLHRVHRLRAKDVLTCIVCGGPRTYNSRRYCSADCQKLDLQRDADEWVFQVIVEFKTTNDGCAPSRQQIINRSGLADRIVRQTLRRLKEAGRIKVIGSHRHWGIVIPGARWVYEGSGQ